MQLLYGNDGVNYNTIAKSEELSQMQERELLKDYLGYSFVRDTSKYSSAEKEPISLTCVTTNLSHTLPEEKILLVKNAKMTNYLTPSYYAHFQIRDIDSDMYGEKFIDLLKSSFISDMKVMKYLSRDIDSYQLGIDEKTELKTEGLNRRQLLSIVASLLYAADGISRQVQVILDVDGDGYNQRALDVIASVYTCIPYNVRRIAGFSTYVGNGQRISNRVKLKLYSREALGRLSGSVIDLADVREKEILDKIPDKIMRMATDFVDKKEQRDNWFTLFRRVFGIEGVSVEEHLVCFENVHRWQKENLENMQDELASYAYKEQKKEKKSPLFVMFCNIINQRFEKEKFLDTYQKIIKQYLYEQNSFLFESKLKAYLSLGEALTVVSFDKNLFLKWMQEKLIIPLQNRYQDLELYHQMTKLYHELEQEDFGNGKLQIIHKKMETELEIRLKTIQEDVKRKIQEEEDSIIQFFHKTPMTCKGMEQTTDIYNQIIYRKPNERVFSRELSKAIYSYLNQVSYFKNYIEYKQYKSMLEQCGFCLPEENKKKVENLLEEKGYIVNKMENCRKIIWSGRKDVLETYQKITDMMLVAGDKDVEIPNYKLVICGKEFEMSQDELEAIIYFVCAPSKGTERTFENTIQKKPGLLQAMLHVRLFAEEHMEGVFACAKKESIKQEKVIDYYMNKGVLLSEEMVEHYIMQVDKQTLLQLISECEDNNLLSNTIQKQYGQTKEEEEKNSRFEKTDSIGKKIAAVVMTIAIPAFLTSLVYLISLLELTAFNNIILVGIEVSLIIIAIVFLVAMLQRHKNIILLCGGIGMILSVFSTIVLYVFIK